MFYLDRTMKITRPGYHQTLLEHRQFPQSKNLCVVHCLKEYINRKNLKEKNR